MEWVVVTGCKRVLQEKHMYSSTEASVEGQCCAIGRHLLAWFVEEGQNYVWGGWVGVCVVRCVMRVCDVGERGTITHTPPPLPLRTPPRLGLFLCTRCGELAMFICTLRPRIAFAPAAAAFARSLATARALPFSLSAISWVSRNMSTFAVPGGGRPPYFIFSTVDVI